VDFAKIHDSYTTSWDTIASEHIARQTSRDKLSVRDWVRTRQGRGGVPFLPYRATEIATLRSLISTWMHLAIFEAMSQSEGDQRLWSVIDELDAREHVAVRNRTATGPTGILEIRVDAVVEERDSADSAVDGLGYNRIVRNGAETTS
jgi:hypothetical protein